MKKYMYRSHPGYIPGDSIRCKNPNSKASMATHISNGSRIGTKYISCTTLIGAAIIYSLGNEKSERVRRKREPVVLIDAERLAEHYPVYDSSEEPLKTELTRQKGSTNFAPASREVLTEMEIPADCMREMPTVCVDMVRAFEAVNPRYAERYIESINNLVMKDDETFKEVLSGIQLEGELGEFYEEYYLKGNTNLEEISNKMFGGDIELANCVRVQVIKELFKNPDLMIEIYFKMKEKYPDMTMDGSLYKKIDEYYVDTIDEDIHLTAESSLESKDKIILGGIAVDIESEKRILLPSGVRFVERDGKRYAIKQKAVYDREKGQRPARRTRLGTNEFVVVENEVELPIREERTLDLASQLSTQINTDEEYVEQVETLNSQKEKGRSKREKRPVDIIE